MKKAPRIVGILVTLTALAVPPLQANAAPVRSINTEHSERTNLMTFAVSDIFSCKLHPTRLWCH